MSLRVYPNSVQSVKRPPTLLVLLPQEHEGWCEQFAQEGYSVVHVIYPSASDSLQTILKDAEKQIFNLGANWALLTYGLQPKDARVLLSIFALSVADLKACVHYCPAATNEKGYTIKDGEGGYLPTLFHLASSQEALQASLLSLTDPETFGNSLPTSSFLPISVHTYPSVPESPPFPFLTKAPALIKAGETSLANPYVRSAANLSHTRTLELLKRHLGPHFDFEKLWERHTYHEFVERDASKTIATMVESPYVNHVSTMVGGVGKKDLTRFYKYHFTGVDVTPPDTELITISRTIGADRIIDEMIFKCTHTTEIDYFLPGIPPTGKPLELAIVGVIAFRGDKLFFEHIYWDQASALVQLGLLDPSKLPIAGVEVARKVIDPFGLPSNTLLGKWKESECLSID